MIIPLDEYNSIKETKYLLSNPNNAKHLLDSIQQLKEGRIIQKELIEE